MLKASIWTYSESTALKDSLVEQVAEYQTLNHIYNLPNLTTDHVIKLEGYITIYKSPLTLGVSANGNIETYVNDVQILNTTNNGSVTIFKTGILPFECYIKATSLPVNIVLTPDIFTLNNGYVNFSNPRSISSKTTTIEFVNPNDYVYQEYYIESTKLQTEYVIYEKNGLKYTKTTVIIPPEI